MEWRTKTSAKRSRSLLKCRNGSYGVIVKGKKPTMGRTPSCDASIKFDLGFCCEFMHKGKFIVEICFGNLLNMGDRGMPFL
jgi:hypothetical protein